MVYLPVDQVATVARDLGAVPGFRRWLLDLASPELLEFMNRDWRSAHGLGEAPFRFGPPEGTAFFHPFGWREAESRTLWDEGRRLGREMRFMWLWRLLGRFSPPERRDLFRRMQTFVLLERGS